MKKLLSKSLIGLLLVTGLGLLYLTNTGILSFDKPYNLRLPSKLAAANSLVAFVNVNLIPMDSERVVENQTVIVRDGTIETIGDSDQISTPSGAVVIDGRGKYLMPGLVDMHVHVKEENELLLFVANGVTSVRNLWGGTGALRWMGFPDHLQMRDQIKSGTLLGPTLYTSGPIMEGPPARMPLMPVFASPEAARDSVAWQKEQGYDFIKVYDNLELEVYQAIFAAADEHQLQVVGHVPRQVGLDNALAVNLLNIVENVTWKPSRHRRKYLNNRTFRTL